MKPQVEPVKTGEGYPFFRVKVGDQELGFRVPEIIQAEKMLHHWRGTAQALTAWQKHTLARIENASKGDAVDDITDAPQEGLRRKGEFTAALGFVILSCWHDSKIELESQSAWKSSFRIRQAIRHNQPLDDFNPLHVEAVREAMNRTHELQTDIQSGFGLVCWDELTLNGFTHPVIERIGLKLVEFVHRQTSNQDIEDVEVLANF